MLSLPMLTSGVGVQPPIALSSRLSEKRFDTSQQQLLRTAGRLAASRLASSLGSANQSYVMGFEEASKVVPSSQELEFSTSPPHSPLPDISDAGADSDAISQLTAALQIRMRASAASGACRNLGGAHVFAGAEAHKGLGSSCLREDGGSSPTRAAAFEAPPSRWSPTRLLEQRPAVSAATAAVSTEAAASSFSVPIPSSSASARSSSTVISSSSTSAAGKPFRGGTAVRGYRRSQPDAELAIPEDEAQWDEGGPLLQSAAPASAASRSKAAPQQRGRMLSCIAERDGAGDDSGDVENGSRASSSKASTATSSTDGAPTLAQPAAGALSSSCPAAEAAVSEAPQSLQSKYGTLGEGAATADSDRDGLGSGGAGAISGSSLDDSWEEDERRMLAEILASEGAEKLRGE